MYEPHSPPDEPAPDPRGAGVSADRVFHSARSAVLASMHDPSIEIEYAFSGDEIESTLDELESEGLVARRETGHGPSMGRQLTNMGTLAALHVFCGEGTPGVPYT